MSVYWIRKLSSDSAVRHALHVRTRQESSQVFSLKYSFTLWIGSLWTLSMIGYARCSLGFSRGRGCVVNSNGGIFQKWWQWMFILCRENLLADCLQGCFVVTCTLCAFISLVWLREQIVHGGAPLWLEQNQQQPANAAGPPNEVFFFYEDICDITSLFIWLNAYHAQIEWI